MTTPLERAARAVARCGACQHTRLQHDGPGGLCGASVWTSMAFVLRRPRQRAAVACPCQGFTEPTGGDH